MSDYKLLPDWRSIHTIVLDFDGVFTDNKVWVDQDGVESVRCDRGDGLAFDLLRAFINKNNWKVNYFILSKERNPVVLTRAIKLKVDCEYGVLNKAKFVDDYLNDHFPSASSAKTGLIYLGNDLNDLAVMRCAGYSVAPSDAHPLIKHIADLVLQEKGGEGFVRRFIELLCGIEKLQSEEIEKLFV